jgi:Ca2+-binding RTX toxin-like protein
MNRRFVFGLVIAIVLLLVLSVGIVLSATNSVSPSGLVDRVIAITANQLKPPECDALNLSEIEFVIPGIPLVSKGNTDSLILGTSGPDDITARKGQDCVVGGGGDDTINGNQGDDVLLGGPGNDDLDGGQGSDVCYGGGGADTFRRCESTP